MTDYREQAVKDVAKFGGFKPSTIEAILADIREEYHRAFAYAVAQREARLRERAALEAIQNEDYRTWDPGQATLNNFVLWAKNIARAALEAGKEKP